MNWGAETIFEKCPPPTPCLCRSKVLGGTEKYFGNCAKSVLPCVCVGVGGWGGIDPLALSLVGPMCFGFEPLTINNPLAFSMIIALYVKLDEGVLASNPLEPTVLWLFEWLLHLRRCFWFEPLRANTPWLFECLLHFSHKYAKFTEYVSFANLSKLSMQLCNGQCLQLYSCFNPRCEILGDKTLCSVSEFTLGLPR